MPAFDATQESARDYDVRSHEHELRMVGRYRLAAPRDGSLLQPLANACWRAACFEWRLRRDAEAVRRLLGEAARALAQGFTRRRAGFDPNPEQFVLGLHTALAAREFDAFNALATSDPNLRTGALREARAFRGSPGHFHLAEGYALVARSLAERTPLPAHAAVESLTAALSATGREWWERQFTDALDAAWRMSEHEAVCLLLGAVAARLTEFSPARGRARSGERDEELTREFARVVDDTLQRLEKFAASDVNHHPKLYLWLPGIALCALAGSAGLPTPWLSQRHASRAPGYARLPPELLGSADA